MSLARSTSICKGVVKREGIICLEFEDEDVFACFKCHPEEIPSPERLKI